MTQEVGLETHPLEFNPPTIVQSTRAYARYQRLVEAQKAGQEISEEELTQHRDQAYGRGNNA